MEKDPELWCGQIDWLLNVSESELGAAGTLASVERVLMLNGIQSSLPVTDLTDADVGLDEWRDNVESPAGKWRRIAPIWFCLSHDVQTVLMAHYTVPKGIRGNEWERARGALGKLVNAVITLADDDLREKLGKALMAGAPLKPNRDMFKAAVQRFEPKVREAHRAWYVFREILGDEDPWGNYALIRDAEQRKVQRRAQAGRQVA